MTKVNMEAEIRIAEHSDTKRVHRYYCDLLQEKIPYIRDNPEPTLEQEVAFVRSFVDGAGDLLLAISGSEVVGMLGMQRSRHYQENHRIHIGISVKKECRDQGLGSRLLQTAINWAAEHDVLSIELDVISTNPAVKLYKKHGFNEIGGVKNGFKVGDQYYDILYMQHDMKHVLD